MKKFKSPNNKIQISRFLTYIIFLFLSAIISCNLWGERTSKKGKEISQLSKNSDLKLWKGIITDEKEDSEIRFSQPRAVGSSKKGILYIIDRSGKVFAFDNRGEFLFRFPLPDFDKGTPTGIGFDQQNNVLLADTHYHRILIFSPEGKEIGRFGEYGETAGKLIYPTDITTDEEGNYYVAEYGIKDRIIKFDHNHNFIKEWGGRGDGNGELYLPMAIVLNSKGEVVVADSCNNRIQCFSKDGEFLRCFGELGSKPGQLKYPYDIAVDKADNVFVIEYGNCRISKFDRLGKFIRIFGKPGSDVSEFHSPWGIDILGSNLLVVADTLNHRIVKIDKF